MTGKRRKHKYDLLASMTVDRWLAGVCWLREKQCLFVWWLMILLVVCYSHSSRIWEQISWYCEWFHNGPIVPMLSIQNIADHWAGQLDIRILSYQVFMSECNILKLQSNLFKFCMGFSKHFTRTPLFFDLIQIQLFHVGTAKCCILYVSSWAGLSAVRFWAGVQWVYQSWKQVPAAGGNDADDSKFNIEGYDGHPHAVMSHKADTICYTDVLNLSIFYHSRIDKNYQTYFQNH